MHLLISCPTGEVSDAQAQSCLLLSVVLKVGHSPSAVTNLSSLLEIFISAFYREFSVSVSSLYHVGPWFSAWLFSHTGPCVVCLHAWESPSRGERSWLLPVSRLLMVKGHAMGAGSSILPGVIPDPLGSHQESKSCGSSEWV